MLGVCYIIYLLTKSTIGFETALLDFGIRKIEDDIDALLFLYLCNFSWRREGCKWQQFYMYSKVSLIGGGLEVEITNVERSSPSVSPAHAVGQTEIVVISIYIYV